MKKILILIFLLVFSMPLLADRVMNTGNMTSPQITARILGYWKTVNKKVDNAQAVVVVYEYNGELCGRVIALYNPDESKIEDDIYQQKNRAAAVKGNPPYCGLDILFGLKHNRGANFDNGRILNPDNGRYYNASAKLMENGNLKITGRYLFFRRTQVLSRITNAAFLDNFDFPDEKTFIPIVPVIKK